MSIVALGLSLALVGSIATALIVWLRRHKDQAAFDGEMADERRVHHRKAAGKLRTQLRELLKQLAGSQFAAPDPKQALQRSIALLAQAHFELGRNLVRASTLLHQAEECIQQARPVPHNGAESPSGQLTVSAILGNGSWLWWFGHLLVVHRLAGPMARPQPTSTSA